LISIYVIFLKPLFAAQCKADYPRWSTASFTMFRLMSRIALTLSISSRFTKLRNS
jgi:hypothetical protein